MRLSQAVSGFALYSGANGLSQNTLRIYTWHLSQLTEYLGDPELASITPENILLFYNWLQTEYTPHRLNGKGGRLSPSSIQNAWCSIRSFYNWAVGELSIERADTKIKAPRWAPVEISPFSHDEIKALIGSVDHTSRSRTMRRTRFSMKRATADRDRALILTLLDTGVRVSELCRISVEDLNLASGDIYIQPWGSGQKTKSRHVFIGDAARRALWKYLSTRQTKPSDPLFAQLNGMPLNRMSVRLLLDRLAKRAGVRGCHPHKFRHTFAIEYLRNGGDVFTLQRLLGHSTLDMVRRYLALADTDAAAAHRRASPVDHWKL